MGLHLDKTHLDSWEALLNEMPDEEFSKLSRSTVPMVAYWMTQELDPESAYHFEYKVESLDDAKASHTDLMIISDFEVVGIEGKSTERRYQTVGEWLGDSDFRHAVLEHWSSMISAVTGDEPDPTLIGDCVYQMVHRLASACFVERPRRTMRYQVFDVGTPHPDYLRDLGAVQAAFGLGHTVALELEVVPTSLNHVGKTLDQGLRHVEEERRPSAIREALTDTKPFDFGEPRLRRLEA